MRTRRGNIVTDTEGLSVLAPTTGDPVFKGGGDINWVCAHCGHLLAATMMPGQIEDMVIKCFSCQTLNGIGSPLERDPNLN